MKILNQNRSKKVYIKMSYKKTGGYLNQDHKVHIYNEPSGKRTVCGKKITSQWTNVRLRPSPDNQCKKCFGK